MERIIPIDEPKSFDCYHDLLTHHYAAPVFYDALRRELSFAKREGNQVGVVKFIVPINSSVDQLLYFANELELSIRQHDLISRIAKNEFVILVRLDFDADSACQSLINRINFREKRGFQFSYIISDGTKGLVQVLEELDNPQNLRNSKTL